MPVTITSLQNPRVKEVVKLRDRRGRDEQGRFRIDGARETRRALVAGIELVELFACLPWCDSLEARAVLADVGPGTTVYSVPPAVFEKVAFGDRGDGIVAVGRAPRRGLADLRLSAPPLLAVLDGVEKPGNVGAVLRSADGAGLDGVLVCEGGADLFHPHVIRASVGTVFAPRSCAATRDETLAWLRAQRIRIVAARVDASAKSFGDVELTGPVAIVLGAEDRGLSDAWRGADIESVALPMLGLADSLNVSAAAAVLFYEARRQRMTRRPT